MGFTMVKHLWTFCIVSALALWSYESYHSIQIKKDYLKRIEQYKESFIEDMIEQHMKELCHGS